MKIKAALALLAAMFYTSAALAMPIVGDISWGGDYTRAGDVFSFSNVEITNATGDFAAAGFAHNDMLAVADIDIGSFTPTVLWMQNGITFSLERLQVMMDIPSMVTVIFGNASVSGAGFDATPFTLVFSSSLTTFSAAAVPEPGTGLLLLSGLIAFGTLRHRRAKMAS